MGDLVERQQQQTRAAHLYDAVFHINDQLEAIYHLPRPLYDAESARLGLRLDDIPLSYFEEAWDDFVKQFQDEEEWLLSQTARVGFEPSGFEAWAERHLIPTERPNRGLAKLLFGFHRQSQLTNKEIGRLTSPRPSQAEIDYWREHEQEFKRLLERAEHTEEDIQSLRSVLRTTRERLNEVSQPPSMIGFGLVALGFLAMTGIVFPLVMMPQPESDFREWHKWAVIVAFIFGLVLVFVYISILAHPALESRLSRRKQGKPDWDPSPEPQTEHDSTT